MSKFVLINKKGHYAHPSKSGSHSVEYASVAYTKHLDGAYLWNATERNHGDTRKAYATAIKEGCNELVAHEIRTVFLGEKEITS